MGTGTGIGLNNVYRRSKNIYIGVNNVARKVIRAYIGVNGVARLFYSSEDWYIPDNYIATNIIAAYRFKTASSEDSSLTNLVNPFAYKLTKDGGVNWTSNDGLTFPQISPAGVHNQDLYNTSASFVILHFKRTAGDKRRLICCPGQSKYFSFWLYLSDGNLSQRGLGIASPNSATRFGGNNNLEAHVGIDFINRKMFYINHQAQVTGQYNNPLGVQSPKILGGQMSSYFINEQPITITAAAFYSQPMTLDQFISVRQKMEKIGI